MNKSRLLLMLLVAAAASPATGQELKSMPGRELQPVQAGELQALVEECNSCHGPNGVSGHADIPSLAGRPAGGLVEAVEQFYFYERHCPTVKPRYGEPDTGSTNMCDVSSRMNRQEVEALGRHYEAQAAPAEAPE